MTVTHRPLLRALGPALVAVTVIAASAAADTPSNRKVPPPLPPLNGAVLEFARVSLGKKVGNGECSTLAADALDRAGAKRYRWEPSGDYIWGRPVASFKEALPGDILQFRDAVFSGRKVLPDRRIYTWRQDYPHHTAIVSEVRPSSGEVVLLHQNFGGSEVPDAERKLVQTISIRPAALKAGGRVWIYRPEPPDDPSKPEPPSRRTRLTIKGDSFLINGEPTYAGRTWNGRSIEGLLLNSRMVQATFDDRNPETRTKWAYPDTGKWDPDRNTREFLEAMPEWKRHGLLAVTLNLQCGSPAGYAKGRQPWHASAINDDGSLRPEDLERLERVLDRADELGMAVILGVFYFGQDERLADEAAVLRALDGAVEWVLERGYRNVLLEVNNECNVKYDHAILKPERVHELIERVKTRTFRGRRLLVGTSYGGGTVPKSNVVRASDFLLMHGNGVKDPARVAEMVRQARAVPGYRPVPILFNEDDHFDFDKPANNFLSALSERASWGYFDPGESNYRDGYQSPPVRWGINTDLKRAFFGKLAEVTGSGPVGGQ